MREIDNINGIDYFDMSSRPAALYNMYDTAF